MSWGNVKEQRAIILGNGTPLWVCEYCGTTITPRNAVGHHQRNRSRGGKSTLENCIIRCRSCESFCHANFKNGNPWETEFYHDDYKPLKPPKKKGKKLRSDRRQPNEYLLIFDEHYAFREYCRGRIQ